VEPAAAPWGPSFFLVVSMVDRRFDCPTPPGLLLLLNPSSWTPDLGLGVLSVLGSSNLPCPPPVDLSPRSMALLPMLSTA